MILCEYDGEYMANEYKMTEVDETLREQLASRLVDELPVLRTKLGVSQTEIANLIDISRQTYSSIETKKRKMSWGIYLSLILVFDSNKQTHDLIRKEGLFPQSIIKNAEVNTTEQPLSSFVRMDNDDIRNHLDEQAIHAIETVIMVEYARCNNMTGDAVIKAFDGKRLTQVTEQDIKARKALESIKAGSAVADKA